MGFVAAIYGAGGHARVVASILRTNEIPILGFFDDSFQENESIQGAPLLGKFKEIINFQDSFNNAYIAIGENNKRANAYHFLAKKGISLPALIHPSALIEIDAHVDAASIVCLGSIIGVEAKIGKGTIINTGCSIDHESIIGDFSHLAPGTIVAGRTHIGSNTFIGLNSAIAHNIKIGNNVTIGAGSIILRDVHDGKKIKGVYH